ncbi:hypothetical protein BJ508DRAFT_166997 [Ascobolus immersus RN42]|uniref:F-box domain-containing protein n=1 Tax=Ascobolus immersus RN42 TaxID=1160509 RepID=A0A3N4IHV4_ASCIM|nr:hypothetical protein BJ508DRAFT_166997 [Ascobolus immersus RN42]
MNSPLLALPLDLRLEIYDHCSAFSLLQLISTSSQLRTEIKPQKAIIARSFGYNKRLDGALHAILELQGIFEMEAWSDAIDLSIYHIEEVLKDEATLFASHYNGDPPELVQVGEFQGYEFLGGNNPAAILRRIPASKRFKYIHPAGGARYICFKCLQVTPKMHSCTCSCWTFTLEAVTMRYPCSECWRKMVAESTILEYDISLGWM